MKYIEEKNDLFNYEGKAWLAHCISADFGMGKGNYYCSHHCIGKRPLEKIVRKRAVAVTGDLV